MSHLPGLLIGYIVVFIGACIIWIYGELAARQEAKRVKDDQESKQNDQVKAAMLKKLAAGCKESADKAKEAAKKPVRRVRRHH